MTHAWQPPGKDVAVERSILIIEDNETLALGLRTSLEVEGYKVECITDGNDGLAWLEQQAPALLKRVKHWLSLGEYIYLQLLGQRTAAAEIGTWKFSGLLAWLMWRGIYLSKLPGTEKKIRVLLDWVVEFFFPRDIVLTQRVSAPDQVEPMSERAANVAKG